MKYQICKFTPEYQVQAAGLLVAFCIEYGVNYNYQTIHKNLNKFYADNNAVIVICLCGLEVVGIAVGYKTISLFDEATTQFAELAWFVTKEHRGSKAGYLLFKELEQNADCNYLHMIEPPNSDVSKFYLKHGFQKFETFYTKKLEGVKVGSNESKIF